MTFGVDLSPQCKHLGNVSNPHFEKQLFCNSVIKIILCTFWRENVDVGPVPKRQNNIFPIVNSTK